MDLRVKKVWLPGAASLLLFIGWCFMLSLVPFENNRFPFITIPYLAVMPLAGALGAYLSRRMEGSVAERILSALFPVLTLASVFSVRIVYGLFSRANPILCPIFWRGFL